MTDSVQRTTLDAPPTPEEIQDGRETAANQDTSVELRFPTEAETKRLVVSPRGTVVLLNDAVSEETFPPSESAEAITTALPS